MDKVLEINIGDTVEMRCKSGLYRVVRIVEKAELEVRGKIISGGPRTVRFSVNDITRIINKKGRPKIEAAPKSSKPL